ncbi:MAG: hypothetical protein ACK2VD_22250 [Anaerolineae bacterium]
MAFLFQSNPDQWDLRRHLVPGSYVSWFVSRYQALMGPGALVLLWEAQGSRPKAVKGLYGWGILTEEPAPDGGRLRVRLMYVERWITEKDKDTPLEDHLAPIPGTDVLALPAWQDHLLAVMPIGTNFLVTPEQLEQLSDRIVTLRFPDSQLDRAVRVANDGQQLDPSGFAHELIYERQEHDDGQ